MTGNLLKYSVRAFKRQKAHVLINVLGLAIGLACSMTIALFVMHEFSYDQHHEHKDRIYRLVLHGKIGGQEIKASWTASVIGPTMRNEFPEVAGVLRMSSWNETVIRWEDKAFTEDHFVEADSTFFDFFSVRLLQGNPATALNEPQTLVLSESTARKIFGEADPMGEMLRVGTGTNLYRVTGVMEDLPETSHFEANMLGSFLSNPRSNDSNWLSNSFQTYLMLHPQADPEAVSGRFGGLIEKHVGPQVMQFLGISLEEFLAQGNTYNFILQPLTDIHLDPSVENEFKPANDPRYLWIFGSVGLLILVVAGINFMNLATAQATKRAREVGIKKVSGSTRGSLVVQFLTETVILAFLALALAILIMELALPPLNQMLGLALKTDYFGAWYTLPVLVGFTLLVGILAGSYPAFYLSSFQPAPVLKGAVRSSRGTLNIRSGLTVLQFAISIVLIVGTLVMQRQIRYMLGKDLGFDREHVLVIRRAAALGTQMEAFKQEVLGLSGVLAFSYSTAVPGHTNNNNGYTIQGRPEESYILNTTWADHDFIRTYGLEVSSGRYFDPERPTDREGCLVNERAVQLFGLEDPMAIRFMGMNMLGERAVPLPVIGTVRDFHFESLRQDIGPVMIQFKHDQIRWGFASIRLSAPAPAGILQDIERIWGSYTGEDPLLYFFMDEDFNRLYQEEQRSATLAMVFTLLAILIASMGLYGLTAFAVAQRTKEIGVRKTFGASVFDIWRLVSKEILILVGIATLIAWPLVYWVAGNWLQNYHYRISLRPADFLAGFAVAAFIALITISYRTIRAASVNPSLSLRYE